MLSTIENYLVRFNNSVCMGKGKAYKPKDSMGKLSDMMRVSAKEQDITSTNKTQ